MLTKVPIESVLLAKKDRLPRCDYKFKYNIIAIARSILLYFMTANFLADTRGVGSERDEAIWFVVV